MKKTMVCLLALALLLGAVGACAEVTLTLIGTMDRSYSMIYDVALLYVRDGDGYAVTALDGTPLTEPVYTYRMRGWYGFIQAEKEADDVTFEGLLNREGEEVVPFIYTDLEVLNANWAWGKRAAQGEEAEGEWLDIYWLPEAKRVATLPAEDYSAYSISAVNEILNVRDPETGVYTSYDGAFNALGEVEDKDVNDYAFHYVSFENDEGLEGLMDSDGNVCFEPAYDYVYENTVRGGCVVVQNRDRKYGVATLEGELVVPMEYGKICANHSRVNVVDGYVNVWNDEQLMGFYQIGAGESCPCLYPRNDYWDNGASLWTIGTDTPLRIIAADGVESTYEDYQRIYDIDGTNGRMYNLEDEDNVRGIVDWHGEWLLPVAYGSIHFFADDMILSAKRKDDQTLEIYSVQW